MANTVIQLKSSGTPASKPSSLANGEIALNYADGKFFYKNLTGQIVSFAGSGNVYSFATINANNSLITALSNNSILTINPGQNIGITSDIINDVITISANLAPAYDIANAAYNYANTLGGAAINVGAVPPASANNGNMWWDSISGRLFIYYTDTDSSQWVEASPSGGVIDYTQVAANVVPLFSSYANNTNAAYNNSNAAYGLANTAVQNGSSFITVGDSGILSQNTTTSTATDQIIDTFSTSSWRSANYLVTMNSGTDYHTTQISVVHNGANAYMTEYGIVYTGNNLALFNTSIVSGSVRLNIVPTFAATTIRMLRTTNK
jgi:hypothetical protein